MAEPDNDPSQKTEEPTHKKLEEARRRGQVPTSREVNHWVILLAGTIMVVALMPPMVRDVGLALVRFLDTPHGLAVAVEDLPRLFQDTFTAVAWAVGLPVVLILVAAAAAGLVQHGPVFSVEPLKPKLERISLVKGMRRLFSARSLVEFAKGIVKLVLVGTAVTFLLVPQYGRIRAAVGLGVDQVASLAWSLAVRVLVGVVAVMTVLAVLDLLYQRFQYAREMRMTKEELKDELKQTEGDPTVKARLRQLRMERARRRMMAAVPKADVVVTNPTHIAVAIRYDIVTMAAPRVVAKGVDAVALKIRAIAEEHDVPLVENPALALALHASVRLDEEISEEHYRAVAEVIGYVWRLKGKMPARRRNV